MPRVKIALGAIALLAATAGPADAAGCALDAQGEGRVAGAIDARTLRLADGREVRLAGIEPVVSAKQVSNSMSVLTDREVILRGADDAPDRYGRQSAFVFLAPSGTLLQEELLARGEALVSATVSDKECALLLMAAEAAARRARRGFWENPAAIKNTESAGDIWLGSGSLRWSRARSCPYDRQGRRLT